MAREDRRPRSEQEREAARIERERRRAEREGRAPNATPEFERETPRPAPPLEPSPDPIPGTPAPPPVDDRPTDPLPHTPAMPPTARHEPIFDVPDLPPAQPHPRVVPPAEEPVDETFTDEPAVTVVGRDERAIGTKRVPASAVATSAGAEGPPRFGAGAPPRRRRRSIGRRVIPLVFIVLLIGIVWFADKLVQPFHGDGKGKVVVSIPSGSSADDIGKILADKGVVSSKFFFSLRARISGDRSKLRAGTYTLKKDMSYGAALDKLTVAPKAAATVTVTIPEGKSIVETVSIVRQAGLRGGYRKAASNLGLLDPHTYGAPKGTKTLEGFLFPSTYELKAGAPASTLVSDQVEQFKQEIQGVSLSYARKKHLSAYDVLIIASMIEREAAVPGDRAKIAAVIYNRLHDHIPLGIDATLRYALHDWTKPLLQSQLTKDGPYNTRTRQGLPPTPIGSPGIASLKAAAKPAKVGYLYYVVKPCGNGAHAFSSTDAQFQQDVAKYNAARAKNGGNDPSHC